MLNSAMDTDPSTIRELRVGGHGMNTRSSLRVRLFKKISTNPYFSRFQKQFFFQDHLSNIFWCSDESVWKRLEKGGKPHRDKVRSLDSQSCSEVLQQNRERARC